MKKILLTLSLLVSMGFATTARAFSFDWGITGGYNLTQLKLKGDMKHNFNSDNRNGWFVGAKANLGLAFGFGLDGALLYSQQKMNVSDDDFYSKSETQRTIAIPLNLKYSIGLGKYLNIYAATGPQFDFCLNNNSWDITSPDYTGTFDREKVTTSWNIGAGTRIMKHLDLGIVYNMGISKVGKTVLKNLTGDNVWGESDDARVNTFKVQATIYF